MGQTFQGLGSSDPGDANTPTKLLQGGTKGLLQGFSNMQNQNAALRQGGGYSMGPMPQAQPVDPSYFQPQMQKKNNLSFYGG